jgi:peptide/nickel transport system permease protein
MTLPLTLEEPVEPVVVTRDSSASWFKRARKWPLFSGAILILFVVCGVFGALFAPDPPNMVNMSSTLSPPVFDGGTWAHPLGTDQLGRDILSRLLAGARVSLVVSASVVILAGCIGFGVALWAGYHGGRLDAFLTRISDAALAFPYLLMAIVIVAIFGTSLRNVIIILVLATWPGYARVLRSEVLRVKNSDYITMSRVMGAGRVRIIQRHVIPNVIMTFVVLATLQVGVAIVAEGSLSFLGIGVPPTEASWGSMLANGREYLETAWWLAIPAAVCLSLTVLAANLMGDWLRTHFDPMTRR